MNALRFWGFLFVMFLALALLSGCPPPDDNDDDDDNDTSVPQEILDLETQTFDLVNLERTDRDIAALTMNEEIRTLARDYSERMADEGFFAHVDPQGDDVGDRLDDADINYSLAGENLAMGNDPDDPAAFIVEAWMASDGHRANILREQFTLSGIGIAYDEDENVYYFTQVFADPSKRLMRIVFY